MVCLIFCVGSNLAAIAADTSPLRARLNFNREWRFQLGDHPGAQAVTFDDGNWESVGLPHSFSLPYFGATNSFYVGHGWYRKTFDVPAAWQGRRLFLHFEGAFQDAEIFINGKKAGAHQGG
jgi:beta-galactosidase/beta-glucuronidase